MAPAFIYHILGASFYFWHMKIAKKTALHLSLSIIVFYWLYQLFVAPHGKISQVNFSDFVTRVVLSKVIQLVVIVMLLKIEKDSWGDMGFHLKNWKKQLVRGILLGFILFLLLNVGLGNLLNSMFSLPAASGGILAYFNDPRNLYIWLAIGIFGGGVVEEVVRIFVLTRFLKRFGKAGLYFAWVFSSFIFGMGHLYQGMGTAISTGISGLVLGGIYIKRNSAIEIIAIHAFSDVLAILASYQLAGHHSFN